MEIYNFEIQDINNVTTTLKPYIGKYLLVVNVASKCGFTPQYEGLESLYKKYQNKLTVVGFPCNQFAGQEPASNQEIQSFCSLTYNVTFPIFAKIDVNGDDASPLYKWLKKQRPGLLGLEAIKWNFTKFLVSPTGEVLKRFAPTDTPKQIEEYLIKLNF